jgi:hypothetical protein
MLAFRKAIGSLIWNWCVIIASVDTCPEGSSPSLLYFIPRRISKLRCSGRSFGFDCPACIRDKKTVLHPITPEKRPYPTMSWALGQTSFLEVDPCCVAENLKAYSRGRRWLPLLKTSLPHFAAINNSRLMRSCTRCMPSLSNSLPEP